MLSPVFLQLAFFSESNSAPRALLHFSSQGPARKKQRGRGSQRSEMSELTLALPPRTSLTPNHVPHSLPTESFHLFSSPARTSISLRLRAIWFHSVEAMTARWTTACHWRLQMQARTTNPPSCIMRSPGMDADIFRILSNAVEELGLELYPPEEPSRSHLDEYLDAARPLVNELRRSSQRSTRR